MNKRMSCLILLISLMVFAAGCDNDSDGRGGNNGISGSVDEVLFQKINEEDNIPVGDGSFEEEYADDSNDAGLADGDTDVEGSREAAPGVDVDLTVLSSTMVYSEVYNMMVSPDNYKGKTVKMKGQYVPYYDENTGKHYFDCFISDATACCSQGIEFILTDEYSYPEDYPQEGDTICVVGTFDTYMEGESMYCTLRDAVLAHAS